MAQTYPVHLDKEQMMRLQDAMATIFQILPQLRTTPPDIAKKARRAEDVYQKSFLEGLDEAEQAISQGRTFSSFEELEHERS